MLLDSALAKVHGNVGDKPAFMAAIKAADFKSVRGPFKFNHNNFPIMDMPVLQVAKDAQGRVSLKTVDFPLRNHEDAYHQQCPLK
jgi:branched-chain amino acid transport system substrate-binding protein